MTNPKQCDFCGHQMRHGEIHWRVYLSEPSVNRVALFCCDCYSDRRRMIGYWQEDTGGRASWHRAAA